jgi:OmpA family
VILPHPSRPDDPNWVLLADFRTGHWDLRPDHREWLQRRVVARHRRGENIWVHIRGLASHLGRRTPNQRLSQRRAHAVRDFLLADVAVSPDRISGLRAEGEDWSSGPENDNSPRWRAVEIILAVRALPDLVAIPPHPIERRVRARLISTPRSRIPSGLQEPGEGTFERFNRMHEAANPDVRLIIDTRGIPSNQRVVEIRLNIDIHRTELIEGRVPSLQFVWGVNSSDVVVYTRPTFTTNISRAAAATIYNNPLPLLVREEQNPFANGGDVLTWLGTAAGQISDLR